MLIKKNNFFLLFAAVSFYADLELVLDCKFKYDPANTSTKEHLSTDTNLTPVNSCETLPLNILSAI
jgi:hypothetical protein